MTTVEFCLLVEMGTDPEELWMFSHSRFLAEVVGGGRGATIDLLLKQTVDYRNERNLVKKLPADVPHCGYLQSVSVNTRPESV